ncbi:MAG: hypothetical protein SFY56_07525 [Bacteroidota bacterium]|nr:hypothetical protein [Bacteroidota bacterium]
MSSLPTSNYCVVIFTSTKSDNLHDYKEMDDLTMDLAKKQSGFIA